MNMSDTNKQHLHNYYKQLLRHLSDDGRNEESGMQFSMLKCNADRVEYTYNLMREYKLLPTIFHDSKDNENATVYRQKGNDMFRIKHNEKALEFYTKSIAFAEMKSEQLALAFANRSAVLWEEGFYKECLIDIERAMSCNYPEYLKPKIQARREKCLAVNEHNSRIPYHEPIPNISEEQQNSHIQCASDAIDLNYTSEQGRHVVAVRNIDVGEIIAIEKPFCHILLDNITSHCHECLQLCHNLIPCQNCTEVMYCSESCQKTAYSYHKYECKILKTIRILEIDTLKLLPMKIVITVVNLYEQIDNFNLDDVYRSDRYNEIHSLEGNTEKRPVSDLFQRSTTAAILYHIIKTSSDMLDTRSKEKMFMELLLKHLQTAVCNFHEISELQENQDKMYEQQEEIASGAFSFLSMFNHSCCPNISRHCYGYTIVVRAMRSIKKGEQCYENYGYHHAVMPRETRQKKLKEQYYFDCTCRPCLENWPLYSNLPVKQTKTKANSIDLKKLQRGDREYAKNILKLVLQIVSELEEYEPEKSLSGIQEVLKQCFALCGNVKRSL